MNQSSDRIIRQYYWTLKRKLPHISKEKKQFLALTRQSMMEYANEHPFATTVDFQQEFGTIEQLCEDYKDFVTAKQMINSIQRTYHFNQFLGVIATILIVFLLYFVHDIYFYQNISVNTILETVTESMVTKRRL